MTSFTASTLHIQHTHADSKPNIGLLHCVHEKTVALDNVR